MNRFADQRSSRHLTKVFVCLFCLVTLSACSSSSAKSNSTVVAVKTATGPYSGRIEPSTGTEQNTDMHLSEAKSQTVIPAKDTAPVIAAPQATTPSATPNAAAKVAAALAAKTNPSSGSSGAVAECWRPLFTRLESDPKVNPDSLRFLCALPEYSADPMGVKVKELFTSAFVRKKKPAGTSPGPRPRIYRNIVTQANMEKCKAFLTQHKATFDAVEKKYPVPREILVSLLFVETRLGTFVGKENALWSLACMAASDSPERVKDGVSELPLTDKHAVWLQSKLTDKSDWAYKELRALLAFCDVQNLDPSQMPGSVYGAIGICQFMPSNLVPYGDDGDGDGVVNLFSEPDAIFSAARYLTRHGWGQGIVVDKQRSMLKRYNNLNIYANTILTLAESLRTGVAQTGPPDVPKSAAVNKKATQKKGSSKKTPTPKKAQEKKQ